MPLFKRKRAKELEHLAQMNALFDKECERLFKLEVIMFENETTVNAATKSKMEYFAFRQEIIFKEHRLHYSDWKRGKGLYNPSKRRSAIIEALKDEQPPQQEQATEEPAQEALPQPAQEELPQAAPAAEPVQPLAAKITSTVLEIMQQTATENAKDKTETIKIIPD